MSIVIKCPGCGKGYKLRDDLAGKRVKCKCGHAMVVPSPAGAEESGDSTYKLAPAADSDRMSSLLDEELARSVEGPPSDGAAESPALGFAEAARLAAARRSPIPAEETSKKAAKKEGPSAGLLAAVSVGGLLAVGVVIVLVVAWKSRPGFASPQEAFAGFQQALANMDWEAQLRTLDPESQEREVGMQALLALAMAESSPEIQGVLKKHGVEEVTDADASAEATPADFAQLAQRMQQRRQRLASAIKDKAAFYADLMTAIEAEAEKNMPRNPALKIMIRKERHAALRAVAKAQLSDLQIEGDIAQGTISLVLGGEKIEGPIMFKNIDGRWFLHVAEPEGLGISPLSGSFDAGGGPP